jgi:hypothetical protein
MHSNPEYSDPGAPYPARLTNGRPPLDWLQVVELAASQATAPPAALPVNHPATVPRQPRSIL